MMGRPYAICLLKYVETSQRGVSTMMTHLHSHVPASGDVPANVRERMGEITLRQYHHNISLSSKQSVKD